MFSFQFHSVMKRFKYENIVVGAFIKENPWNYLIMKTIANVSYFHKYFYQIIFTNISSSNNFNMFLLFKVIWLIFGSNKYEGHYRITTLQKQSGLCLKDF